MKTPKEQITELMMGKTIEEIERNNTIVEQALLIKKLERELAEARNELELAYQTTGSKIYEARKARDEYKQQRNALAVALESVMTHFRYIAGDCRDDKQSEKELQAAESAEQALAAVKGGAAMSERLDGKKQLEEMLNRPILDFDKKLFCAEDGSFITSDFGSFLQMQSMQHQIDELTQKLSETQKDLAFRRDLYKFQEHRLVQLSNYLAEATAEVKKWKDNHDNQVKINQLLRDRPDLGDRAKSVDALIKQRDTLVKALQEILERNDYGSSDIAQHALAAVKGDSHE